MANDGPQDRLEAILDRAEALRGHRQHLIRESMRVMEAASVTMEQSKLVRRRLEASIAELRGRDGSD
jgi:hypothetical protein